MQKLLLPSNKLLHADKQLLKNLVQNESLKASNRYNMIKSRVNSIRRKPDDLLRFPDDLLR